ncbi:MAG: hypothetical protein PHS59_18600 [Paludibacter sp.]|nr:hypothetical protein [Paludibacter sp.]
MKEETDYIVLKNAVDAKKMIRLGYIVKDIKAKKESPRETVFIFERTDEFMKDLLG